MSTHAVDVAERDAKIERLEAECDRLRAQRDALLEAAKMAEAKMCSCFHSEQVDWHGPQCPKPALRAAIAKAEGKA